MCVCVCVCVCACMYIVCVHVVCVCGVSGVCVYVCNGMFGKLIISDPA